MKKYFGFFTAVLLLPALLLAYSSPGKPTGYVNDFAGMFSTEARNELEIRLAEFAKITGNEISVVTIEKLSNESIETYAEKLFQEWGIGDEKLDNGLLLLISESDREMRIEVGYGLEPIITDIESSRIIREVLTPAFKNDAYDEGVALAVERIINDISTGSVPAESSTPQMPNISGFFYPAIVLIIIFASFLGKSKSWWAGGVIGGVIGIFVSIFLGFMFIGLISLAVLIPLGLLFDFLASRSYQKHKNLGSTPWWFGGGGHGGGGFGGFGGGMSGGGGASGRW